MRVAIVGATGFIGRALTARLQRDGHEVVAVSRGPARARGLLGDGVTVRGLDELREAVHGADAVVNLAGENVLARRWGRRRKEDLWNSRVQVTRDIVAAIEASSRRPGVLVSASAVGFYGDSGDRVVDELTPSGGNFLAALCRGWEEEALSAEKLGLRVVLPRVGVVLGPEGGAWPALRAVMASGFGGALGTGAQWVPWIHLDDAVEALVACTTEESWRGAVNLTAPRPVTNLELSRVVAARLRRSLAPSVPAGVLRLLLGERAQAVLDSQRVEPRELARRGFSFEYPDLDSAVAALVGLEETVQISPASADAADAWRWGRARHTLTQVTELEAGIDEVFAYFSRAQNLGPMTPAWTEFRILGAAPKDVREGSTIDYRLKLGPVPIRWRTLIARWAAGSSFVDVQARGPYRLWWHEHRFEAHGERTLMFDTVHYALPFGPLGALVHRLFVARTLRRIFGFRRAAMVFRFGLAGRDPMRAVA